MNNDAHALWAERLASSYEAPLTSEETWYPSQSW